MHKIDLHTHILPRQWPSLRERYGYGGFVQLDHLGHNAALGCACANMVVDGRVFRTIQDNCWDPSVRLREMDALEHAGLRRVDAQVLSTVPVMFAYWAKPQDTLDLARLLNDHLAEVCRETPSRFVGLGTLPMNDVGNAIRELERCMTDLGMAGVQIGTNVNGMNLGDPALRPIFARAQELDAAVFVHPWDMLGAVFNQNPAAPAPPVMNPRYADFWAAWLVGMPAETCLCAMHVMMSGMLDEFPRLRMCFAHGGGSLAGTIGRIEHGFHARPDLCQNRTKVPPKAWLRTLQPASPLGSTGGRPARFYVDSLVHDADALRTLMRTFGPERIALGSDYPFPLGEDRPGELIESMHDLTQAAKSQMLYKTALEFLGSGASKLQLAQMRPA